MTKENQRITITKRLLKEALMDLITQKNIQQISVSELCKYAGINRATFYRHYGIPQDVLIEMEKELLEKFKIEIPLPSSTGDTKAYIEKICQWTYQHQRIISLMVENNTSDEFIQLFQEIVVEYRNINNDIRKLDEDSLKVIAVYCGGGTFYLLRSWIRQDIKKTPQQMAELIYDLIVVMYKSLYTNKSG